MHYFMGIYDHPFELVASGKKTVEVRLFDRKRRKLKTGDLITFNKLTNPLEDVTVRIKDLTRFPTFKELYEAIPAKAVGAEGSSLEKMLEKTHTIYSPEKEQEWGTIAITIEKHDTD
ncbi:ASC-1 homology (ASCH) domain-containing protein [Alkalibacterium subtropicum]|uniref:ASC-1 homology (ASCH) domain-containing protein n=1 Tax=Alkalibacterium subtropicum TaxID=753702 RepID=A0A1I1GL12_9LACT|nr:ASCH domain-containing protein [Alkalibacterium subtropicum]SFC12115.1 ASC-1 homology (ASCH) domain-containing protein [Alkalibacterium subtropicum]